jgi:hypothetical protein
MYVCTICDAFMLFYTIVHSGRTTMPNAIYYEKRHCPLRRHDIESSECRFITEKESQNSSRHLVADLHCGAVTIRRLDKSSLCMRKGNARSIAMKSSNSFRIPSCRPSSLVSKRLPFHPLRRSCPQASG